MGRDTLLRTLKRAHLLVPPRRAFHKTTHSFHRFHKHPNLLKPGTSAVVPERPEQVWVADITYLPTQEQCVYLSLVTIQTPDLVVAVVSTDSLSGLKEDYPNYFADSGVFVGHLETILARAELAEQNWLMRLILSLGHEKKIISGEDISPRAQ